MIKVQGTIPKDVGVAVSGGVDSMVALDFLRRRHNVHVYHFNHGTDYGNAAMALVVDYCHQYNIPYTIEFLQKEKPKKKSQEEFWRDERYAFFKAQPHQIVMAHHLDDCVETYVFNMCNGTAHHMPYQHANAIRPFRLNRKNEIIEWANKNNVPYLYDPSNENEKFTRNYLRHTVIPAMLKVNPGIYKVVKKQLIKQF